MAYPVTLNGRTYTLADFEGTNYVEGLPDAFEDFVTHAGDIYNSTSTTSNSIGTGSKTFTVESAKPYQAGTPLRIADAAAPSTNFIDAIVTSYSGTTLVVDSVGYAGSGTFTSWNVNIGGSASVAGTVAIAQGGTGATTAAAARTNLDVYSKADADSRFLNVSGEASDVTMTGNVTIGDAAGDTLSVDATATFTQDVKLSGNIEHVGDDDTYFGFHGNNLFRVVTGGVERFEVSDSGIIINDTGGTTTDFRIESDTNANALFVDASASAVGMGITSSPANAVSSEGFFYTIGGSLDIASNTETVKINRNGTGGNNRVNLGLYNNGTKRGEIGTYGAADGLYFYIGSSSTDAMRLQEADVVFNQGGADRDFRVESDTNANAFVVDGETNKVIVGAGQSTSQGGFGVFTGSLGGNVVAEFSDQVNATLRIDQVANKTNAIGGNVDHALVFGYHNTSTWAWTTWGRFNGTSGDFVTLKGAIFNDDSGDHDFRVESDSRTHALFVDASTSTVNIDQSANFHGNRLNIEKSDDPDDGPEIVLKNIYRSGTTTADELGSITFGSWRDVASTGSYVASIAGHNVSYPGTSGQLRFYTRSSGTSNPADVRHGDYERMRIVQNGDIYFGTLSALDATGKFHFSGSETGGGTGVLGIHNSNASGDNSPCLVLTKASTTTTSTARFLQFYADDTSQPMGGIVGNGATNVQFASISDERLKENISSISGSLAKINNLRPVEFDLIGSGEHVPAGFIAQEVEAVFPEYVIQNMSNGDDDARKGITGGMSAGFVAHLVQAIKELSAKNDALEARISALESN